MRILHVSFADVQVTDLLIWLFSGDGDSGSGEASGDEASGSGDDSEAVYVNDLWHFDPNTTYSLPGSTVANQSSSMLPSAGAFVVWLIVVCVIGMMSKPLAQWQLCFLFFISIVLCDLVFDWYFVINFYNL